MSASKVFCHQCKKEISLTGQVGRREECPHCRADLHACLNCRHYDPKSYNECHEPQAERVLEKARANYCDFFSPGQGVAGLDQQQEKMRAAAEALFKKK
jgi:hypothetical protein